MNAVEFVKYHGLGNDFVVVDATESPSLAARSDWGAAAKRWCNRHTGIGADGILLLMAPDQGTTPNTPNTPTTPPTSANADVRMHIFNSDGSEGLMCGNGLRCIAAYMLEHKGLPGPTVRIQTRRAVIPVTCERQAGRLFTVNMGRPGLDAAIIPVRSELPKLIDAQAHGFFGTADDHWTRSCGLEPGLTCVSMGNPHAVFFCGNAALVPMEQVAPGIATHPMFPEGANVHFVQVRSRTSASMRTWERGAGPTLACGTGACAAIVAGVLTERLARSTTVTLPGGEMRIRWDEASNQVFMTGPAEKVFRGVMALDG